MADQHEMTVKLGFEVDQAGMAKAMESLAPLLTLVNALKDLEKLGIRVQVSGFDAEPCAGLVAD